MATLWIDNNLVIRHSEKGWPVMPGNPDVIWMDQGSIDQFNKALAQAKVDSILVDLSQDEEINIHLKYDAKPDTFIEFDGEVDVVDQYKNHDWKMWEDVDSRGTKPWHLLRKVARLKPASSAIRFTEPITEPAWIKNDGLKHLILKEFEKLMGTRPNSLSSLNEALNNLGIK